MRLLEQLRNLQSIIGGNTPEVSQSRGPERRALSDLPTGDYSILKIKTVIDSNGFRSGYDFHLVGKDEEGRSFETIVHIQQLQVTLSRILRIDVEKPLSNLVIDEQTMPTLYMPEDTITVDGKKYRLKSRDSVLVTHYHAQGFESTNFEPVN